MASFGSEKGLPLSRSEVRAAVVQGAARLRRIEEGMDDAAEHAQKCALSTNQRV